MTAHTLMTILRPILLRAQLMVAASCLCVGPAAYAADLTKVTIVLSTSDQDVSYEPYGPFAQQMGWFKAEGLDVTIETAPSTGQVIQLVLANNAQFGQVSPDALLLAGSQQPTALRYVYTIARKQIWGAVVLPRSPIQTFGDMKGKAIGLPSESPAINAFVGARMHDDKADLQDVKIVATGYGMTSMEALKDGTIAAFVAWPGLFASYENAGYTLRQLPDAAWQSGYYGIGLGARDDYIQQHPDVVAKIGRGLARSAVVLKTDPEAMVHAFWRAYPTRAPLPGEDEAAAMTKQLNILRATAAQMRVNDLPANFSWGSQDDETWTRHVQNLVDTRQLAKPIDPTPYYTNAFAGQYNAFDHNSAQAK